jgi:VWFA-related protein
MGNRSFFHNSFEELSFNFTLRAVRAFLREGGSARPGACVAAFLLAAVGLVGGPAWQRLRAQAPAPQNVPSPTLRVSSRLVLVDTVVTDKDGHPVKGLTASDFTVTENKKAQKIATFSFQDSPVTSAAHKPPGPLPPGVTTNRSEYITPPGPPTVILLDSLNTLVRDQGAARLELLRYMEKQLTPGQPIAVYTLGRSLRVLQGFTDDPRLLRLAVDSYRPEIPIDRQIEDVQSRMPPSPQFWLGSGALNGGGGAQIAAQHMMQQIRDFYTEQAGIALDDRVGITLSAFRIIARALAGMPGRKNLIWVSGSFPLTLMKQIVHYGETQSDPNYKSVERTYEDNIRQTASFLTDAQVAVYSVDARGLLGSAVIDASAQGTNDIGLLKSGAEFGADVSSSNAAIETTQASMALVSNETGGRLLANRNDIDNAVAQSVVDGSSYYMLGYSPEDKNWDGKFRTIQVEVNKPGVKVRSRRGYYAADPALWVKENRNKDADLLAEMALSNPVSTMIIFDAHVVPPPGTLGDKAKLQIDFLVDSRTLSYQDDNGGRRFELDFHAAAYGPDGKLVAHQDVGTKAGVKAENIPALEKGGFPYHMELEVSPGRYTLRLGVRDTRTGFIGTADLPLVIGK